MFPAFFLSAFRCRRTFLRGFFRGAVRLGGPSGDFPKLADMLCMALCAGEYRFECCEKSLDIVGARFGEWKNEIEIRFFFRGYYRRIPYRICRRIYILGRLRFVRSGKLSVVRRRFVVCVYKFVLS